MYKVIKRSGASADFAIAKIGDAIEKAFISQEKNYDRDIIDLRDSAYELERALDLLHSDSKNALDFYMAKKAEEQANIGMQAVQTGHRLNILAAIFFPLTAIASIFGMNLRHGFEGAPIGTFWGVFLFGLILGFLTRKWVLK